METRPAAAGRPEVRHATFLMGDIVDSTRLANRLDLDDQRAIASAFRVVVLEAAKRHAGHVLRFEGDGAFVSFGHPVPSEDAAESAVRCGLDLVGAVQAIDAVPGVKLQLRVGVASGLVAVGDLNDRAANVEEAIEGPVPSMAERIKSSAEPGWVVIADSTRRLAAHFFDYVDLGTVPAKGFDGGLRAWRVLGETAIVSRFEAQRHGDEPSRIFGRDPQLDRLDAAWQQALHGAGQAVALVGDPGLGKSRLARAILAHAQADGATVLEVNCMPSTGNTPLFPIGVLLRRTAGILPQLSDEQRAGQARALLERLLGVEDAPAALPYLAPLFGVAGMPLPSHQTPGEVRAQTVASIVRIVRALAVEGPLALLCEDLHWADASTASVVQQIAAEIGGLPAMLMVTSRTLADAAIDAQQFAIIELSPLGEGDATALVVSIAALAGHAGLSPKLVRDIVARGEGVPLILEEITRNALEAVRGGEPEALASVPATLQLAVQARLGRWPQLKPIVQAASVVGREFSIRLLERMLPDHRAEIAATIALLAVHGLFANPEPRAADRAQFKHALIRDTVYQTLLRGDRQRLHSAAADALAGSAGATADSSPEVLARHLFESQRFVEAIRTQLGAAADAAARGAFVEAAGYCDAALPWVDKVAAAGEGRLLRFGVLVQRAVALAGKSGYAAAEVEQAYQCAYAMCDDSVTAHMRYPIIRGLAGLHLVRGQLAAAHEFSLEGLRLAEASGDVGDRIDALSMRIYTTLYFGSLADCRALIERFLELYADADGARLSYPSPHDAGTAVLAVWPTVAWLLGDSQGCEAAIQQGLAHVERLGRPFDQAMLHAWVAGTRYTQRRYAEAAQHAMQAIQISTPRGFRDWLATGGLLALLAQVALQPSAPAVEQLRQLCMAFAAEGVGLNASYYAWGLARGLVRLQDWSGAEAALDAAAAQARASGETRMNAELLLLKAQLPAHRDHAATLRREALQIADAQGDVVTALRAAAEWVLADPDGRADPAHESAERARARSALARLDGQNTSADAGAPGWMAQHLAELKQTLALYAG